MKISDKGLEVIKQHEGLCLKAYVCPAGVLTIGYGHTGDVLEGQEITEDEAERLLRNDVSWAEDCVNESVEVSLTQNQFDALVSFVYNIGCNAFRSSTLLRLLNSGNTEAAAQQFHRWNKGGGRVLAGLTKRRAHEAELFLA